MSWKQDEWKENLPSDALSHITTMESSLDKLQSDITQLKFKTESLTHTASVLTDKVHEKEKELKESEREIYTLRGQLEDEMAECKELNIRLKRKDDEIYRLNKKIDDLKRENEINEDFDIPQSESVSEEETEAADSNTSLDMEQQKHLEMLLEPKNEKQTFYKEKVLALTKENENLEQSKKDLQETNAYLEEQIETLNAEKAILETRTCCLENKCYTSPRSKTDANNNSENEDEDDAKKLEGQGSDNRMVRHNNEFEPNISGKKLPPGSRSGHIGEYLGIDIRSYSDSEIATISYSNLLDENRRLLDELETLRTLRNKDSCKSGVERVVHHVLSDDANTIIDSGVDLPTEDKMERNIETMKKLDAHKKEVDKLRNENLEMKQVYENHMKVCGNQKNDSITENIRSKSEALGNLHVNVKSGFSHLEEKCVALESKLTDISSKLNSSSIVSRLDHLTDSISRKNINENSHSIDMSAEVEQLKSDLLSNFFTVQDEIHKGHEEIRREISSAKLVIIENMFQTGNRDENANEERRSDTPGIRKNGTSYYDEKRSNFYHVSTDSVSELETIKERLGGIQHSISESINEKRRAELERHKLQDELVKLVETLKRKDQELGRVTQLYEVEKQKLNDNDSCFRNEMEELKREQLEIYEEFRNMCETLKRKDIELANRNKQIRLITAERREKEDELNDKIGVLQSEKVQLEGEKNEISKQYHDKYNECQTLLKRFVHAEEQLRSIFNNFSRVEGILLKAKSEGLYK